MTAGDRSQRLSLTPVKPSDNPDRAGGGDERRSRPAIGAGVAAAAVVVAVIASLCWGSQPNTVGEVWHALVTPSGTDMDLTIRQLRFPRTLTGVVAGACLGVAGMLAQGHTRNPVADPGLLGINQGAALAIVAATAVLGGVAPLTQAGLALAGGLAASVIVFLLSSVSRHGASPITLVLAGAALTAVCGGLVTAIVLLNDAALETLRFWQVGSLSGDHTVLAHIWWLPVIGLVLAAINAPALNLMALGEETARSLGVSLRRARWTGVAGLTVLAAAAVTLVGPIAFAGLVVPHIARAVVGVDHRWLMPTAALLGSALLLLADTAGRVIARPGELSVGVVLAVIGAPFFIYLARRRRLSVL